MSQLKQVNTITHGFQVSGRDQAPRYGILDDDMKVAEDETELILEN